MRFKPSCNHSKATHSNRCGDFYEPQGPNGDPYDPQGYVCPLPDHVHFKDDHWHKDIDYKGCSGRHAALLIGAPEFSFLWDRPEIAYPEGLARGQKKLVLGDLIRRLVQNADVEM